MKQRIITGAVLIVLAVLWMFYFPWYAYLAASVLIAVLGGWEWGQFISAKARVAYGAAILVLGGAAVALIPGLWGDVHNHYASFGAPAAVAAVSIAALWWIRLSHGAHLSGEERLVAVIEIPEVSLRRAHPAAVPHLWSYSTRGTATSRCSRLSRMASTFSILCSSSGARTAARTLPARISESTT